MGPARRLPKFTSAAALLAALALYFASAAMGSTRFEAAEYPAAISGEQIESHVLGLENELKVSCKKVSFTGELEVPGAGLTVSPSYTECSFLGSAVTIKVNGCQFVLKGTEETSADHFSGTMDITCPAGQSITVIALSGQCEAKISGQTGIGGVSYVDEVEASPQQNIKLEQSSTGIKYTAVKDEGFFCPFAGTGEKSNGSLSGKSTLKASYGVEAKGLAIITNLKTKLCEEAPVNDFCPKIVYGANTVVKATGPPVGFPLIKLNQIEGGAVKNWVECTAGDLTFETKEQENVPLHAQKLTATFNGGKCQTKNKTGCTTVAMNPTSVAAEISNSLLAQRVGSGNMAAPVTLEVDCGKEIEQCKYARAEFQFWILGGSPARVSTIDGLPLKKTGGKNGCFESLSWVSTMEVTAPAKPLYVTY